MNKASGLLQLLRDLSQLRDRSEAMALFVESLNRLFAPNTFIHAENQPGQSKTIIPISNKNSTYGYIAQTTGIQVTEPDLAELNNAVQMLAMVLDKLDLEKKLDKKRKAPYARHKQNEPGFPNEDGELERFFLTALDLLCIADTEGHFLQLNREWERALGYRLEDLEGKKFFDLVHPEDLDATLKAVDELKSQKEILNFTNRYLCKDGSYRWIEWRSIPNGNLIYAAARDVTDRKKMEAALQLEKEFRQRVFDGSRIAIVVMDATTFKFIDCNPAAVEIYRFQSRSEVIGKTPLDFSAPIQYDGTSSVEKSTYYNNKALKEGKVVFEWRHQRADGELWDAEVHLMSFKTQERHLLQFTLQDITERKKAENELLREKQFTEKLLESLPGVFFLYDQTCHLKRWNKAHETALGFSADELSDWYIPDWHESPEDAEKGLVAAKELLKTGIGGAFETTLVNKKGEHIPYLISMNRLMTPEGPLLMGVGIDITERKQAEAEKEMLQLQLVQSQKIESIGRLAGGVAHDFNNMLQAILGNTEIALMKTESESPVRTSLQEIQKYAQHSADLTRQLLAFARKQTIAPKVLNLNETVAGMLKMLRRLIGEDIDLAWLPGKNLGLINMDPSQIDQILANLCINARDAIGNRVGRVTIETANAVFDDEYCTQHADYIPGEYIQLTISDDGSGMDAETLTQIFEPFFTTKEMGKGTGLGLSTVYGVVKQNNGFINVYSELDHGTAFKIFLPRHAARSVPRSKESQVVARSGEETVLLVEDEESILTMVTEMLESLGYTVFAAKNPDEAISLAREHKSRIDLLITDVVMPKMNGRELSQTLLSIHPDIKCLFMSGYTADVIAHHGVLDQGVHFIQKPFDLKALTSMIHKVLVDEE